MTDRIEMWAESIEQNDQGAVADIKGSCGSGAVNFSALIVDTDGKPTVQLPQRPDPGLALLGVRD